MDEDKNEELENFLEQELKTRLQTIPEEFKKVPFNPLPSVVKVLQSDDRNEKVADLEDHFDAMESALNMIVEGDNEYAIKLTSLQSTTKGLTNPYVIIPIFWTMSLIHNKMYKI